MVLARESANGSRAALQTRMTNKEIENQPGFWCWSQKGNPIFGHRAREQRKEPTTKPKKEKDENNNRSGS